MECNMSQAPPAVQILPMSKKEFGSQSIDEVQAWILSDLPWKQNGRYHYAKRGLGAEPGTIVLFQFKATIVGKAVFEEQVVRPEDHHNGFMRFDVGSIETFASVGKDVLRRIWPKFSSFNQARHILNPEAYQDFERCLKDRRYPDPFDPRIHSSAGGSPQRAKATVWYVMRDSDRAQRVKRLHNYECQLCGFTIERRDGTRYAEAHHIQPLGRPHNGDDVEINILCLCPNCHAACDLGVRPLTLDDLRQAERHCINSAFLDYHNSVIFGESYLIGAPRQDPHLLTIKPFPVRPAQAGGSRQLCPASTCNLQPQFQDSQNDARK